MLSEEEDNLIDFLEEHYGCHTFILYGSRAMETHTAKSDWDILALNNGERTTWCHKHVPGVGEVNAYIYPEKFALYNPNQPSPLFQPRDYFIRLRHGKVLIEKDTLGRELIALANQIYERGPGAKPAGYDEHIHHVHYDYWLRKIADTDLPDMERQYWRARLLHSCLDNYFKHRETWSGMAPKDAFNIMREDNLPAYEAYRKALLPDASVEDLKALLDIVLDPRYAK